MIAIEVQDREVLDYLNRLSSQLDDMTPVLDAIGQRLEEQISYRFETETDPTGAPWAPWAESTLKTYPKAAHRHILDRYGDMMKMSHRADRNSVEVGSAEPYLAYHEYGTEHMTRRGVLYADPAAGTLGDDDRRAILDLVESYLDG